MVDPHDCTRYGRRTPKLEEFALFCVLVFFRNADRVKVILDDWLREDCGWDGRGSPFAAVHDAYDVRPTLVRDALHLERSMWRCATHLQRRSIGLHTLKGRGVIALANSCLDLKTCAAADLERLPGISFKTSRFFLLHTRRDAGVACLDTHILRWLADQPLPEGTKVPRTSPQDPKVYARLERLFLERAEALGRDPAELDLSLWKEMRSRPRPRRASPCP